MTSKHPNCECKTTRYQYFRKQYKNKSLHLMRRCIECGKTASSPMRQSDYDNNWIEKKEGRHKEMHGKRSQAETESTIKQAAENERR